MKPKTLFLVCLIVFLLTSFLIYVLPVYANPDTLTLRPNATGTYSQFVEVPNSGFLFGDQFENATTAFWNLGIAGTGTFAISTDYAHTGTYSGKAYSVAANDVAEVFHVFTQGNGPFYGRAYYYFTALGFASTRFISIQEFVRNGFSSLLTQVIVLNTAGTFNWRFTYSVGATTATITNTTAAISLNTWYCVEESVYRDASAGNASLWVNGQLTAQALNINNTNYAYVSQFYCGFHGNGNSAGATTEYIDDGVLCSTSSGYIGTENRQTLVSDSSDNTALQVTANVTEKEILNLADTAQTGTINSVTVDMRVEASTTSIQALTVTRTHGTDYEGLPTTISNTAFTDYTTVYSTNPYTSSAWTWAEVNALEVGARASTLPSGTIQFSEFYIIVDYQSDVTPPTYYSISANTTIAGALCSFSSLVSDDTNVSTYIFSTNNTGTWTNDTANAFSNFFNTTAAWANVTKTLNDTVGNVVSYLWYANDTSNNWSSSDQYDFTLTAPYRPSLQMTPENVTCRIYLETFSVQINVTNALNLQAFNFTIYYDPSLLNFTSVSWGELGIGTMTNIDAANGILEGNAAGPPVNGNHWMMNITFQAINATIWKEGLANKLEGKIWFHQAQLNFTDNSSLQYLEGGINQIDVNQVAYTFLPIRGDVNNDGTVNILDLRIIAFYFGKTSADPEWPAASKYDLTNDNVIDVFDLRIVAQNFGFTYP